MEPTILVVSFNTMASSRTLATLVILAMCFASTTDAVQIVNKKGCLITVFAPPICEPCKCPHIECIRAPCPQPDCFCTQQCKFVPGVEVEVGGSVTLKVAIELFPLAFLTVEVKGVAYVVLAVDLKLITETATVVVTEKACSNRKNGIVALVCSNPKCARSCKSICLLPGDRYGS